MKCPCFKENEKYIMSNVHDRNRRCNIRQRESKLTNRDQPSIRLETKVQYDQWCDAVDGTVEDPSMIGQLLKASWWYHGESKGTHPSTANAKTESAKLGPFLKKT